MNVGIILSSKDASIHSIHPNQTLAEAADILAKFSIGATVVINGRKVVGMLSERDIVRAVCQEREKALSQPVYQYMSSPVVACDRADEIKDVMEIMSSRRVRHLPVVEGDEVVGIVSIGDVLQQRLAEKQVEAKVMRDYALAVR